MVSMRSLTPFFLFFPPFSPPVRYMFRQISDYMVGAGIEDVNHELVGGIYSQMLWGESFEEAADGR